MTVVLHPVDLHHLATDLEVPANVTLLPLPAERPVDEASTVVAPADDQELRRLLPQLAERGDPALVLLGGPEVLRVHPSDPDVRLGRGEILVEGDPEAVCVLACGAQVGEALAATMDLQTQGIRPRIVNVATLRPLDVELVRRCATAGGALLVVEAPPPPGVTSLGQAVSDALSGAPPTPVTVLHESQAVAPEDDGALVHPYGPLARDIRVAVTRMAQAAP